MGAMPDRHDVCMTGSMKRQFPQSAPGLAPAWSMIAASVLLAAAVVALLLYLGLDAQVMRLLHWVEARGAWAPLLFVLVMAVVVVLLLPGVLLTTGAGFVFGVFQGTLYVVSGTLLGAVASFLIARHLFSERTGRFMRERSRLRLLGEEAVPHAWKVVLLTRLIPFFPSKLANYIFGLTPFSLRAYVAGSLIGFVPYSLHNVYLGSLVADLATLRARDIGRTPFEWGLYLAGFAFTVIAVLYLSRIARRAFARYESSDDGRDGVGDSTS
jgi:uncharacterized membrane protein YdjX (TVP38/TMEM64 family)